MAKSAEEKESERKGRTGGLILGMVATMVAGVVLKETCDKNIVDAADSGYRTVKAKVTKKIDDHKAKKAATEQSVKKDAE